MILKLGSKGRMVKELQRFLNIKDDGVFGPKTEQFVKIWQGQNHLKIDGIVGRKTMITMGLMSTDEQDQGFTTSMGLYVNERHMIKDGEYKEGPTDKHYVFLHHTAGWDDPCAQISQWESDKRGPIGTEFVIGGQRITDANEDWWDGQVYQAFPEGGFAWHLGLTGSHYMHKHSVGIEICNFGHIVNGKTYAGQKAHETQIVTLDQAFKGYKTWHKYSNDQIEATRKLLFYIAERDNIDLHEGLVSFIKEKGVKGFEFNQRAYKGEIQGLLTHANVRKDKNDIFPQQEMIDMLLSL